MGSERERNIEFYACRAAAKILANKMDVTKVAALASSPEGLEDLITELTEAIESFESFFPDEKFNNIYPTSYFWCAVNILKQKLVHAPSSKVIMDPPSITHDEKISAAANRLVKSRNDSTVIEYSLLEEISEQQILDKLNAKLADLDSSRRVSCVEQINLDASSATVLLERVTYYKKQIYLIHPRLPLVKIS